MKQLYLLIFILISFNFTEINACGCTTDGSFLQVAIGAELIAVVEVQDYGTFTELMGEDVPMSMTLKIKKILKGEETRKEITVWGNNGLMCSPYLSIFEQGTTWVMSLKAPPTQGHDAASIDDYGISNCGEQFMKVENGIVRGLIKGGNEYQSMSISTLKGNLDIINRNNDKIDLSKGLFIKQLRETGVDTIGVFEHYNLNNPIRSIQLKVSLQIAWDDAYPSFYEYIYDTDINRQVFVYWQSQGRTYVKQIDYLFDYETVETSNSLFFSIYNEYNQWLISERLKLPKIKKTKQKKRPKQEEVFAHVQNNMLPKGITNKKTLEVYVLQSFQIFIGHDIFLRDFDIRLFEKSYNPSYYKKNCKTLTYEWLSIIEEETEAIAEMNEQSENLFRQYKRLYSLR